MGSVLRYRGTLAKPSQVEVFEDQLVELAVDLGGYARLWRSTAEAGGGHAAPRAKRGRKSGARVVRGLMLDLAPGLGTISFVVSPEGQILDFPSIAKAEENALAETPWVSVETRFAQPEGHAALCDVLRALSEKRVPDLEVEDDSGFYAHRNLEHLLSFRKLNLPAEEHDVLARRIAEQAERIRKAILQPSEHPPVVFDDEATLTPAQVEEQWDSSFQHNERRNFRMQRTIEEETLLGRDSGRAFMTALRDEGLAGMPGEDDGDLEVVEELEDDEAMDAADGEDDEFDWDDEDAEDEPWKESIDTPVLKPPARRGRDHPLGRRMEALVAEALKQPERRSAGPGNFANQVIAGILDASGALTQALSSRFSGEAGLDGAGLRLVQLKRALRGVVFARAAIPAARGQDLLGKKTADRFTKELLAIESAICNELEQTRKGLAER